MKCCPLAILLLLLPAAARAAENADAAAQVAPFVDELTLAVVQVDVGSIDFDATGKWLEQLADGSDLAPEAKQMALQTLRDSVGFARDWCRKFAAAGGRRVFLVFTFADPTAPLFVVVPLEKGANAEDLKTVLAAGNSKAAAFGSGDCLVLCPNHQMESHVKSIHPQNRPELDKALAEAGGATIQVALIPSDDVRKVVESMVGNVYGAVPVTTLTRGIRWASAALNPPPNASAQLTIHSQNTEALAALVRLARMGLSALRLGGGGIGTAAGQLLDQLPQADQVKSDQATVKLGRNGAEALAAQLLHQAAGMWLRSARARSENNVKQLLLALVIEANNQDAVTHSGQFPQSLQEAMKAAGLDMTILKNPLRPEAEPGYIYVRPPEGLRAPGTRLVIYESFKTWPGAVVVGFADGHVELIESEPEFDKLLKEAKAAGQVHKPADAATGER